MRYNPETIETLKAMNPDQLSGMVDGLAFPDTEEAKSFLSSVRDAVVEQTKYTDPDDWEREVIEDYSGSRSEIAAVTPNVYTWPMWQQFVGLSAWQWDDDATDYDCDESTGMEDAARLRLYIIADRLALAVAEYIAGDIEDTDTD